MLDKKGNWIKLHREICGHWVTKRPEWFMAWTFILIAADHKSGTVNLTEVYRKLGRHLDYEQWRHFVGKLKKDRMLNNVAAHNKGHEAGFQQTATIANWSKYQAQIAQSQPQSQHRASTERNTVQDATNTASTQSQHRASTEPTPVSNKNKQDIQELQEIKHMSADADAYATTPGELVDFYRAWNANAGSLRKSFNNKQISKALRAELKRLGHDALQEAITKGAQVVARDSYWLEKGYGLDNLLRNLDSKVEQYHNASNSLFPGARLSDADRRLAAEAERIGRAIGAFN